MTKTGWQEIGEYPTPQDWILDAPRGILTGEPIDGGKAYFVKSVPEKLDRDNPNLNRGSLSCKKEVLLLIAQSVDD